MDTRIFICTHKKFPAPKLPGYVPLNVGSALRDDLGYERDDQGDQISEKNPFFCELTGVYYVWKNVDCDIVGICHYRRYFAENGTYLSAEQAEDLLKTYDVILPASGFTGEKNLWIHYEKQHYLKDMQKTREILLKKYPAYEKAFDHVMNCNLFSLGNMIITRKSIYDDYCAWLFDILFDVEKETDLSSYDTFQARLYGYLSERLLRVWLLMQNYRVVETGYVGTDLSEAEAKERQVTLVRSFTDSVASDVINLYRNGQMQDLIEDWPSPDFKGKIPVFLTDAPDPKKREELENLLPKETVLIVLNKENQKEYAFLPEHFINLPEVEQMELFRAMVLYRYGGFWIDPAVSLPPALTEENLSLSFYSIRRKGVTIYKDMRELRWDPGFMYAKQGSLLMGFLMNSLCYFRFRASEQLPFSLTDCLIDCGIRNLPELAAVMETVPFFDEAGITA